MEPTHDVSHLTERSGPPLPPPKKIGKDEEKGLSPSKNYQVLTTSLGKNLPPSLLPKDEKKRIKIVGRSLSAVISPLGNSRLLTNTRFAIYFTHLTCDPLPERINLKLTKSNSVRARQYLATEVKGRAGTPKSSCLSLTL